MKEKNLTPDAVGSDPETRQRVIDAYDHVGHLRSLVAMARKALGRDPVVEAISAASSEPEKTGQALVDGMALFGVTKAGYMHFVQPNDVTVNPHSRWQPVMPKEFQDADNETLASRLRQADIIYICGGDQQWLADRIMGKDRKGNTAAFRVLRDRYFNDPDLILAGTSAGAMVMSGPMINGGNEKEVLTRMNRGFDFITCPIDTHLGHEKDRHGKEKKYADRILRTQVVAGQHERCIGLNESTGLVIRDGMAVMLKPIAPAAVPPVVHCFKRGQPCAHYMPESSFAFDAQPKREAAVALSAKGM